MGLSVTVYNKFGEGCKQDFHQRKTPGSDEIYVSMYKKAGNVASSGAFYNVFYDVLYASHFCSMHVLYLYNKIIDLFQIATRIPIHNYGN